MIAWNQKKKDSTGGEKKQITRWEQLIRADK